MDYMQLARLLCPWDSPGKNTGVSFHALLLPDPGIESRFPALRADSLPLVPPGTPLISVTNQETLQCSFLDWVSQIQGTVAAAKLLRLCAIPETAAHQAPPSLGFSRQEHWSGLPFPSPAHESEK